VMFDVRVVAEKVRNRAGWIERVSPRAERCDRWTKRTFGLRVAFVPARPALRMSGRIVAQYRCALVLVHVPWAGACLLTPTIRRILFIANSKRECHARQESMHPNRCLLLDTPNTFSLNKQNVASITPHPTAFMASHQ